MSGSTIPAPHGTGIFRPDTLILYGVKLNSSKSYGELAAGEKSSLALRLQLYESGAPSPATKYSLALSYAYSYDGHCYRFDSLRTFIVTDVADEQANGCGFEHPFRMWPIQASTQLLEIATSFGDAKTLILDANFPGRRSPTAYAIHRTLGNRNRTTEE